EAGHVGVAADHAVQYDDVRAVDLRGGLREVHDLPLHPVGESRLLQELPGDVLVRGRELDADGPRGAGLQQLELDGADAAAHLEHGAPRDAVRLQVVDDAPRRRVETFASVALRLRAGAAFTEHPD